MTKFNIFSRCLDVVITNPPGAGIRHLQCLILFFCLLVAQGIKGSVSVAIVAMTTDSVSGVQHFNWDKKTQDVINSSFFWGYVVMQLPAGQMAARFGGKRLVVFAMTMNGLFSLLTPSLAYWADWYGVCAGRAAIGLTQGLMVPSYHTILGKWVPPAERGRLSSFVYGGGHLGTVLFMAISGLVAGSNIGWPSAFYYQGCLAIFGAGVWAWWGADSPAAYKTIKIEEKEYIQLSLGQINQKIFHSVPWRHLLLSVPVWAICAAHAGQTWGHITLISEIPSYMSKVMHTNIQKSGIFTALPFLAMWLMMFVFSFMFDALVNKGFCTPTSARKLANTIGSWPVAIGLIGMGYIPIDNVVLVEILLIVTIGIKSSSYLGYMINHMDLSPNFAGTIMSLTNFIANSLSILAPITAGLILTDETDVILWRYVFLSTALVYFISNLIFVIFGTGVEVPWNDPNYQKDNTNELTENENPGKAVP